MPTKYCKSSEKVCPAGPPGYPGSTGARGPRGRRGPKGKKGPQGPIGPPGKSGKTGMMGFTGPKGVKGDKGESGPKGMPGPPGSPGKSLSAPQVMLSPAEQTRDEKGNTAFYCTVVGNPSPVVEWQFKGTKLLSGAKYLIKQGELIVRNLNYSDAGPYTCAARNILGSSEATGNLTVRGLPFFRKVPPSLATPVQGTTFQVTCQADGYPRPAITWTRAAMPLPAGKTSINQGTLTINNLSPADNGFYDCVATNIMGTKKKRLNLAVQVHRSGLTGYPFQRRFLERGIIFRTHESSTFVSSHLKVIKDRLLLTIRLNALTSKPLYSCCTLERSIKNWPFLERGISFRANSRTGHKDNVANLAYKSSVSFLLASGSGRYQYDSKAFLFSLVNKPGWAPVKLSQSGQSSSSRAHSIFFRSTYGPTFGGGHDINIKNYASSNSNSYSELGYTYSPPSGYSYGSTFARTFLAGTYSFTPDEVETFYETT
ncbi:unnamed protein product [Porites lobata]|uniref:Ig-like domain-containing protein n=1 Tax=Porites lobata TaxID=104759 RepID=A0ABN8QQ44_9CNID|nr:unnamed protein product [Porites lobata]